ncbi:MAG: hypothetical protein RSD40_02740 [Bacilli bacterium]
MYNQLIDIMKRLDTVENNLRDEKIEHKEEVENKIKNGTCKHQVKKIGNRLS